MTISEQWCEDEVREGFYVPAIMKRCWAGQLILLDWFKDFCQERGIRFFLGFGALLGAVRHGGFIPWDDDIDLFMFRADIEKLQAALEKELPEGFLWQDPARYGVHESGITPCWSLYSADNGLLEPENWG